MCRLKPYFILQDCLDMLSVFQCIQGQKYHRNLYKCIYSSLKFKMYPISIHLYSYKRELSSDVGLYVFVWLNFCNDNMLNKRNFFLLHRRRDFVDIWVHTMEYIICLKNLSTQISVLLYKKL